MSFVISLISMFLAVKKKAMIKTVVIFSAEPVCFTAVIHMLESSIERLTLEFLSQLAYVVRAYVASQPEQKAAACC